MEKGEKKRRRRGRDGYREGEVEMGIGKGERKLRTIPYKDLCSIMAYTYIYRTVLYV